MLPGTVTVIMPPHEHTHVLGAVSAG